MLIPRFVAITASIGVGVISLGAGAVFGQDYPNRPVRVVTSAAGGGSDFAARMVAQVITGPLGQQVIVDNRGTGILSSEFVSKAPPDGYTLLVNGAILWINPLLTKSPYDVSDFSPISQITREVNIIAVHPSLPAKSVKELIGLAKARPGALNAGVTSPGGSIWLATELFKAMAGVNIVSVAYKGAPQALTDVMSGELQMTFTVTAAGMPLVKAGRLRALAVTSATPSALTPGLPTVAASVPGYESIGLAGMWAPAKTPAAIINRLSQEIARSLSQPDVKEKFLNSGVEAVGSSPEEFATLIKTDSARIGKVIKETGLRLN